MTAPKGWAAFRRQPIEPWSWWLTRHDLKLFLFCFGLALIF